MHVVNSPSPLTRTIATIIRLAETELPEAVRPASVAYTSREPALVRSMLVQVLRLAMRADRGYLVELADRAIEQLDHAAPRVPTT